MPARIDPCLALLKPRPPKGRQWAFEVKWDGYRLAVHIEPKGIRILSIGSHDWTDRFPAIAAAARRLPLSTAILDGEGVVFNELGRSISARLSSHSAAAAESGRESIIAKDRNSTYCGGRGGEWQKIECIRSDDFAIVGHQRSSSASGNIGAAGGCAEGGPAGLCGIGRNWL